MTDPLYRYIGHPDDVAKWLEVFEDVLEPVEPDYEACNQCGGPVVAIRGRYPGSADRRVCPTCLVETVEALVTNEPGAGIGDNDE